MERLLIYGQKNLGGGKWLSKKYFSQKYFNQKYFSKKYFSAASGQVWQVWARQLTLGNCRESLATASETALTFPLALISPILLSFDSSRFHHRSQPKC